MRVITISLITLLGYNSFSQPTYECGTPPMDSASFVNKPWYGNNQYLLDKLDSLGYGWQQGGVQNKTSIAEGGFEQILYWVPLKAWVYNDDNGDGGISQSQVEASIRRLNAFFAGRINNFGQAHAHSQIQFYLKCNVTFINSSQYAVNPSGQNLEAMMSNNYDYGALNVHFAQTLSGINGFARFPGVSKSFTCVISTDDNSYLSGILAHEVGHTLDLVHTHNPARWGLNNTDNGSVGNCRQESVSRTRVQGLLCQETGKKKCEVNGDVYCDTEADPNLQNGFILQDPHGNWFYDGGEDNWDDEWNPNVYNIMSYTDTLLLGYFSPMQVGTMWEWVQGKTKNNQPLNSSNNFVDVYEPDNVLLSSSEILMNTTQHRGLHADRNGSATNPTLSYCDKDWVQITVPGDNLELEVNIFTEPVPGKPNVDTEFF